MMMAAELVNRVMLTGLGATVLVGMFDLERPDNRARLDELPEAA